MKEVMQSLMSKGYKAYQVGDNYRMKNRKGQIVATAYTFSSLIEKCTDLS